MGIHWYISRLTFLLLSIRLAGKVYISSSSFFLLSTLSRNASVRVYAWGGGKEERRERRSTVGDGQARGKPSLACPLGKVVWMNISEEIREGL